MAKQYTLPKLPYELGDLEPVISKEIMDLHYNKHHQAYITKLNEALENYEEAQNAGNLEKMISLQPAIRFNGGGYVNHAIFWTNLAPEGKGGEPSGSLVDAIKEDFGSLDKMKEVFTNKTVAIQGSGWGWLGYCNEKKRLEIATCSNQDPLAAQGLVPLLGIDVWEHAYYLQYKNVRPDYVKAIWKIVNWDNVAQRFSKAKS